MKIIHIKKGSGAKYIITLINGEQIITYDDVILKYNILFKKEIDENLLSQIKQESLYYEVYHKTVKYIMTKLRSEKEIKIYLEKYPLEECDVNSIIEKLKSIGLLDNQKYAKAFVMDKLNLGNYGPDKIKHELFMNGVSDQIIEDIFDDLDQSLVEKKLRKLMKKKLNSNHKYSTYYLKQKLVTDFVNLGFDKQQVSILFDELYVADTTIIKKEYDKLYYKLGKKYEGKELLSKIKQKLYQKGFQSEEISSVIED